MNCGNKEDDVSQISIENELNKPIQSDVLDTGGIHRGQLKNDVIKHDY